MPGVDVAITAWPFAEEHASQVADALDGVVLAELCIPPPLASSEVEVTLENAFAGHNFPSGAAQDRRFWLELRVWDQNDQVIFQTGVVADDEPIAGTAATDPNLWLFRDRIFDAAGDEVHMFWQAASFESMLLPQASVAGEVHRQTRVFTIPLADGIPARAEMRLLMRPMGLEVLADLVTSGHLDAKYLAAMPTFEVVQTVDWSTTGSVCVPADVF
jgi:hypothetical protein